MPVTKIATDPANLTITAIGDYPVTVARLWTAFADARQIEQFWGPPGWPATFSRHDMAVGGRTDWAMHGPDGEVTRGFWTYLRVQEGLLFEVTDQFMNEDGTPVEEMPGLTMLVRFEETDAGSRFVAISTFPSVEALEMFAAMGAAEGWEAILVQLDDVLAA